MRSLLTISMNWIFSTFLYYFGYNNDNRDTNCSCLHDDDAKCTSKIIIMILVNKLLNETKWTNELWQNKQTKKLLVCQFFLLPNHSVFQFLPNNWCPQMKKKNQMEFLSNNIVHTANGMECSLCLFKPAFISNYFSI